MALLTYNGTNFDSMLGSATITGTNVATSLAGITSAGVTAPNLVNLITGCWIWVGTIPTNGGNFTVEVMEAGVSKALATINNADLVLGANYVRFAVPYLFASLTASTYTCRVKNTSAAASPGQLRTAASGLWFQFTYDSTVATPTTSHDVWVGGFNDAGLTAKNLVLAGTSNAWGTGTAINLGGSTTETMGAALTIGSGGTVSFDQTASTTLSILGSVFTTVGGTFDMRPPSTKSIISTLIIDSASNGQQGLFSAVSSFGGQHLTRGATYDIYSKYASGLGTAASPMITSVAWDADVGDEIVIGGGTDYSKNEVRYIKTRNSSTSFVLCTTPGGAEVALANTHAAGAHMSNLTRNSVIKALTTSRGFYVANNSFNGTSDYSYTRFEYSDCTSGKGIVVDSTSAAITPTLLDGIVIYKNTVSGRAALTLGQGTSNSKTYNGIILYDTQGGNFSAQSGITFNASNSKTLNDCFHYNAPGGTVSCGFLSLGFSSTANTFNNCHSYGGNSVNSSAGYVVGLINASGNTFNNCSVNGARRQALTLGGSSGSTFNNCNFGDMGVNGNDMLTVTGTLNQALFNACTFGSVTLISNYLNQLDGSLISFQDMDSNTSKHRWYTNYGSWWSAGAGLTDTTVRTASSLSLVSKPENNTIGSSWTFKIPAAPASSVSVLGYVYRNATFSSGTLKVELFLPGTLLTATPDATYTFPTTTGAWLPFNIAAYYSGSVARYATVRITGVTSTAGAYFFVDDLYDAGTGNKVAGLDLWDAGQPSPIMVVTDFSSAVPVLAAATADAVWDELLSGHTTSGSAGKVVKDGADSAELVEILSNTDATQAKVDQL